MELLYNPDHMPEEEIKATFVAREQLVDELVALVESQSDGAGVQHAVIIAPRGMGKTTVLLMVKFAIKDRGLADRWQAVKFPEESYGIYDLADFWIETLNLIAADTADAELRRLADDLKTKYPNNEELQEAAYAAIKDWRRKHGKRLLLLLENFDLILGQINDERDNARLRDALMNDDSVMVLGGAITFFKEARAYDQPLYNFFKIYDLADLKFAQMQELLRRRAKVDRIADFETKLKQNANRLHALEYFTGGNPRLVLMLYRVVSRSDVTEVRRALEKLLDEVTPYYKAKVETLPPQQRKILDHIARISGETNEGLTPGEIATAVRLSPNQVSAQLKRLSELGYVRASNLRVRNSWYTLSEPLYAIWHQMRFGRSARERMGWLIGFLKALYTPEEMKAESSRLERRFRHHVRANHSQETHDVLEHHRYLIEAMVDDLARLQANAKASRAKAIASSHDEEFAEAMATATLAIKEGKYEDALLYLDRALNLKPDDGAVWYDRGHAIWHPGRYEEALTDLDRALKLKPDNDGAWNNRGIALDDLGRYEEAVASYDKALEIRPNDEAAWYNRGIALRNLDRYEDALASYDRALELQPDDHAAWEGRGEVLNSLHRHEEALASFDQALRSAPNCDRSWWGRGYALSGLDHDDEAITSYDRVLEINSDLDLVWYNRGCVYLKLFVKLARQEKFDLAKQTWSEALESGKRSENENWPNEISKTLLEVAKTGQRGLARQLIAEAGMEEHLFPLARAIDYLQTRDEALIEKLSPEVRGIVEEVVARLKGTSSSAK